MLFVENIKCRGESSKLLHPDPLRQGTDFDGMTAAVFALCLVSFQQRLETDSASEYQIDLLQDAAIASYCNGEVVTWKKMQRTI